jgi:hypothetical protein
MPTSYFCREADHEDLTEKVRTAIFQKRHFFELLASKKTKPWNVVVTCGQGHKNKFTGTGWQQ